MAYSTFSIDQVAVDFGIKVRVAALFESLGRTPPPTWLVECLARCHPFAFQTEKSRNEFVVAPILVGCRELLDNQVHIYSGVRLDVDATRGLQGECDFVLAYTPPTPVLEAPFLMVVEAKRNDLEFGAGQCAAQMIAARIFNEKRKRSIPVLYGCVTTGDDWQFMKLEGEEILMHPHRLYLRDIEQIIWAMVTILKDGIAQAGGMAA